MKQCVLLLAVATVALAASPVKHSEAWTATVNVFEGTLEGFFAGSHFANLKNCANDTVDTFDDIKAGITLLEKKTPSSVLEGLKDLGAAYGALKNGLTECKAAEVQIAAFVKAIEQFKTPKAFAFHVGKDLIVNGKDILKEVEAAIAAFKSKSYLAAGQAIGEALNKLIIGEQSLEGKPPAPPAPLCFHMEDVEDHKCFEACSTEGKFATKGIDAKAGCPAKYNTVDSTKIVLQCPDGVTNTRYCAATAVNVTIATKGEDGLVSDLINDADHVAELNSHPGMLWKAGANTRFDGLRLSDVKSLTGVKEDSLAAVLALPKAPTTIEDSAVPDSFDSETNWPKCAKVIGDIRDQSNCGCCWAFGGASAASDRLCISTNGAVQVPLSAQDICFCSSMDGCGGGQISTPWSHIASKGVVTGGQQKFSGTGTDPDNFAGGAFCSDFSLPHCHHHGPQGKDPFPAEGKPGCASQTSPSCPKACDSTAKAPNNNFASDKWTFTSKSTGRNLLGGGGGGAVQHASGEAGIQKAIMEGGPVETAFTVYTDFANYVSGVYHHVSGGVEGGHAVRIVGWGVDGGNKYWKVANSWNPYWGEKGYFRIKRGGNECGIENGVTFSAADAKWSKKA